MSLHLLLAALSMLFLVFGASATPVFDWSYGVHGKQLIIHVENRSAMPVTLQIKCGLDKSRKFEAIYIIQAKPHATASKSFPFSAEKALPNKSRCEMDGLVGYASATGDLAYRLPFAVKRGICVGQAPGARLTTHAGDPRTLQAIDFLLNEGEPVVAAREGIVYTAIDGYGRGPSRESETNVVQIVHTDGTVTLYAHLLKDSVRVKVGQRVLAGEQIALSGMSGKAFGPHLHFAVGHPLRAPNQAGQLSLQEMVTVPANFEIGGKAIQIQRDGLIKDSNSTPSYQPQSSLCAGAQALEKR